MNGATAANPLDVMMEAVEKQQQKEDEKCEGSQAAPDNNINVKENNEDEPPLEGETDVIHESKDEGDNAGGDAVMGEASSSVSNDEAVVDTIIILLRAISQMRGEEMITILWKMHLLHLLVPPKLQRGEAMTMLWMMLLLLLLLRLRYQKKIMMMGSTKILPRVRKRKKPTTLLILLLLLLRVEGKPNQMSHPRIIHYSLEPFRTLTKTIYVAM
jgi:hypothetical protein